MLDMSANTARKVEPAPRIYLREWRERMRMTQEQVAERMGTTKTTVSRYETVKRDLGVVGLSKYAKAIGIEPSQLFRHPDNFSVDDLMDGIPDALRDQIKSVVTALLGTAKNLQ